jgi:arylsulfatase A-like enzyme
MWEGGIRVPATIVWPKGLTEPMVTEMRASTLDILPTIMDLLGISLENRLLDGISLLPLLQGNDMSARNKAMPFWRDNEYARISKDYGSDFTEEQLAGWKIQFYCPEFTSARTDDFSGWSAWIEGKWKLHKHNNDTYELYDIDKDPAESEDLASQFPEVVKELTEKMKNWQRSTEVSLTGEDNKIEPRINLPQGAHKPGQKN